MRELSFDNMTRRLEGIERLLEERVPRRSRNRVEDRLARVEEKLAARRVRRHLTYTERVHNERLELLSQSLLEVARMEAEGNTPPEQLARLRWAADETFRRGKPVSPDEYEKALRHSARPGPRNGYDAGSRVSYL